MGQIFLFYSQADVLELKQWAQETRRRKNEEGFVVGEAVLAQHLVVFLKEYHCTQREVKILRAAAEPLFPPMLAFISGYALLTSHNRLPFEQWFQTWSAEMKGKQLRLLAEAGGFLEKD